MTEKREYRGEQAEIIQGDAPPLPRRGGESDPAYAAKRAYCQLPPGERSVSAAFRAVKGEPTDSKRRAPGRFFAWSKTYDWPGAAVAWDEYALTLPPALVDVERQATLDEQELGQRERLQAVNRKAVEHIAKLQEMIDQKIEERQTTTRPAGWRRWLNWLQPGRKQSQPDDSTLLELAATIKEASFAIGAAQGHPVQLLLPPSDEEL